MSEAKAGAGAPVEIWTDGACSGNPGPGGWGALLRYNGTTRELSGAEPETTNNRMELQAVIEGLSALKERCHVIIHTDSKYVMDGVTKYLVTWKMKGWKTADKKEVKNIDLWQKLDDILPRHRVDWVWVRGHDGHAENERADALARGAITKERKNASQPDG